MCFYQYFHVKFVNRWCGHEFDGFFDGTILIAFKMDEFEGKRMKDFPVKNSPR